WGSAPRPVPALHHGRPQGCAAQVRPVAPGLHLTAGASSWCRDKNKCARSDHPGWGVAGKCQCA
ncbi:unnamed protein product, partial [Heterosigma akashiwo]